MIDYLCVIGSVFAQAGAFCLSFKVIFNQNLSHNKWKWASFVSIMTLIHSILYYAFGAKEAYDYSLFTQILIPILLIEGGRIKYVQYIFISVATPMIGIVPLNIVALVRRVPIYKYLGSIEWLFVTELLVLIVMFILYVSVRKTLEDGHVEISISAYIAIIAVACSSMLFIACVQVLSKQYRGEIISIIGVASAFACLIPVIVVVWMIRTEQKRSELEIRNRLSEELLRIQKNYNENIIASNEKIRRFRHDFKGHVQVMKGYCREHKVDKINDYLNKLVEDSVIDEEQRFTGNMEVDAIIYPMVQRSKKENIDFNIRGHLPKSFKEIDIYDICSIIYNLVNNSVEECEKMLTQCPWINIEVADYNGLLKILIENSAQCKKDVNELKTNKEDTYNHGIGIKNVKRLVEKYKGKINIESTDSKFKVEILI